MMLLASSAVLFTIALAPGQELEESSTAGGPVLDARMARHVFGRFGFGARPDEIDAVVGLRATELFDRWIANSTELPRPTPKRHTYWDYGYDANNLELKGAPILELSREEQVKRRAEMRLADRKQFRKYMDGWFGDLVAGRDPLRDKLTLFWHGFFPTSSRVTLRRYELILQHHFLRSNALGGFDDLLRGIIEDPAMLGYFDNDTNSKTHPNENFARELMELYSLGVGNYSEVDVREAARALTGYQGETGIFVLDEELHDFGEKTILGQTGEFDGADLAEIILQQDACSLYVSRRLLTWMEGVEPEQERWQRYADLLRESGYELTPWLKALVADPEFYRDEIIGSRVLSPVEYLVGASHRLQATGRETFLFFASAAAGQQIYCPPSVKGWDEGKAWITSSSMTVRGNCIGLLLGHVQIRAKRGDESEHLTAHDAERVKQLSSEFRAGHLKPTQPAKAARLTLGTRADDEQLIVWMADSWLARAPIPATLATLRDEVAWCREHFEVQGPLLLSSDANQILNHLAYMLLRLPIAQLG